VRRAARVVTQLYDRSLAKAGLRVTQFSVLARLTYRGPATINGIATDLSMDRTTLGRNIKPLQRDGLLESAPDPADRRSRTLRITAAGRARVRKAKALWQAAQAQFEATLGVKPAAELRQRLRGVVAMVPADSFAD
jgi:DNA-binding MarR family transcriptional regulator